MSLQTKRKMFFAITTILFFVLVTLIMLHPVLEWADAKTLEGAAVIGIPLSQFMILFCAFSLAILVSVLFSVDTKVLIEKSDDEGGEPKDEHVKQ